MKLSKTMCLVLAVVMACMSQFAMARSIGASSVKIQKMNTPNADSFFFKLVDSDGNPITDVYTPNGDYGCNTFFGLGVFQTLLEPDPNAYQKTGITEREHLKVLHTQVSAAVLTDRLVDLTFYYDDTLSYPLCFLTGITL